MNRTELKEKLENMKVPSHHYSLTGMYRGDEEFCMEQTHDGWTVYFAERGSKYNIQQHQTESEACLDLYHRLKEVFD